MPMIFALSSRFRGDVSLACLVFWVIIQCGAFNTMAQTIVNTETLLLDWEAGIWAMPSRCGLD
jgi:hypothetical protein